MALKLPAAMHGCSLLQTSEADLFQIIESAITVAAMRCPQEFLLRRDQIAEKLFSPVVFTGYDCSFGETNSRILNKQDKNEVVENESCSDNVDSCVSNFDVVKNEVTTEKKQDNDGSDADKKKKGYVIKIKLSALNKGKESKKPQTAVQESKTLVQESTKTEINSARKGQERVGNGQPDLDDDILLRQKLEAAKKKLRQGYQLYEDAKSKKRIRVIDVNNVPKPPTYTKRPRVSYNHQ